MESGRVGSTGRGPSIAAIGPIRIGTANKALIAGLDNAPRLRRSRRVADPRRWVEASDAISRLTLTMVSDPSPITAEAT